MTRTFIVTVSEIDYEIFEDDGNEEKLVALGHSVDRIVKVFEYILNCCRKDDGSKEYVKLDYFTKGVVDARNETNHASNG